MFTSAATDIFLEMLQPPGSIHLKWIWGWRMACLFVILLRGTQIFHQNKKQDGDVLDALKLETSPKFQTQWLYFDQPRFLIDRQKVAHLAYLVSKIPSRMKKLYPINLVQTQKSTCVFWVRRHIMPWGPEASRYRDGKDISHLHLWTFGCFNGLSMLHHRNQRFLHF